MFLVGFIGVDVGWLVGWLVGWSVGRSFGRSVGWLVVVVAAVLVVEIVVRPLLLAFRTFPEYRTSNKITFNDLRFLLKSYLTSGVLQETNFQTKSCISQVSQTDFMRFLS